MLDKEKRIRANRIIVARLTKIVEKDLDLRFHQLLQNVGIESPNTDQFYEESEVTLKNFNNNWNNI